MTKAELTQHILQLIEESTFDLRQESIDELLSATDGRCPTCGTRPLTMGVRQKISEHQVAYLHDADESTRLSKVVQRAQTDRGVNGLTAGTRHGKNRR